MESNFFRLLLFLSIGFLTAQSKEDAEQIQKIYHQALSNGTSYQHLTQLCQEVGGRLSGSPEAEKAVKWGEKTMKAMGFDNVFLQKVRVPHWVRGERGEAQIVEGEKLAICALGGSIATDPKGIKAQVIEVHQFEELKKLGQEKIAGKIVFFNRPMDGNLVNTFHAYGGAVGQRVHGAKEAAKLGAIAVIVRSMTLCHDNVPHTGVMGYDPKIKKIPAAAISLVGADLLSQSLKKNPLLHVQLKLNCKTLPDVDSYNVIGEYKGTTKPEEYIVVGGHLDSWDLGKGAHDDGAGCVQALEVVHLFKSLNIRTKRTIRVVLFMNEENGLRGGREYATQAGKKDEKHLAALESDSGGFTPKGFRIDGSEEAFQKILSWKKLLEPYGVYDIKKGGGGADISPLRWQKVLLIGLKPDSQRYFDYHHSTKDTIDKVHKRELELGGAALASLIYLLDRHDVSNVESPNTETK